MADWEEGRVETKVIFDATTQAFPWEPIWVATGAFVFGGVLLLLKKLKWRHAWSTGAGVLFMVMAVLWMVIAVAQWQMAHRDHVNALASGRYQVVQGTVEDFRPMPKDGSAEESFTISGQTFSYSDYDKLDPSTCFHQTASGGGPVHEGMRLRIKYVDKCILQIEEQDAGGAND